MKNEATCLAQAAAAALPQAVSDYRTLHAMAEVGFDLQDTAAYVRKRLADMGYAPVSCGRCGIVAVAGDPQAAKGLLLRADMDALPMQEESGLPYCAQNGRMHACGHDMHTAMLLGAAQLLKTHEHMLKGFVKLMFQPAEELLEGAKDMLSDGVLSHPKPQAALMLHVLAGMPIAAGTACLPPVGVSAPAAAFFRIRLQGKGCHGAAPHRGIDPITAAAHCLTGLQAISARELAPGTCAALTVGRIAGGMAANVIADTVTMEGTMRAFDDGVLKQMKDRLQTITESTAQAHRVKAEVSVLSDCPTLRNDPVLHTQICEIVRALLPKEQIMEPGSQSSPEAASEDFAELSHVLPAMIIGLAAGDSRSGYAYPLHHPKVRFDERAMEQGILLYAGVGMLWGADEIAD